MRSATLATIGSVLLFGGDRDWDVPSGYLLLKVQDCVAKRVGSRPGKSMMGST